MVPLEKHDFSIYVYDLQYLVITHVFISPLENKLFYVYLTFQENRAAEQHRLISLIPISIFKSLALVGWMKSSKKFLGTRLIFFRELFIAFKCFYTLLD